MNGVFLDAESLADLDLSPLIDLFDDFAVYNRTSPDEVAQRIKNAEVVVVNKVILTRQLLKDASKVKLVCLVATGTDNVDAAAAAELGITVCNCQAYGTDSVVQHVFALIFAMHTSLLSYDRAVREGRWQQSTQFCLLDYPITELKGKNLGIIGYGTLGKGVAAVAKALGMNVLIGRRPGNKKEDDRIPLPRLLQEADVLTLHCPLTEHTRNIIGAEAFKAMKPTAFLINAARGGIVDEAALAAALRDNIIAGAATDVLTREPPDNTNPLLAGDIPNLIITPHCAWGSLQARTRIVEQTVENITAFVSGRPIRVIN